MEFDQATIEAQLDAFTQSSHEAIRPAAQAGAQVFYDEVRMRVPVSSKGHWFHGTSFKVNGTKYWYNPGALKRSIYQVFSEDNSSPTKAQYHIAWNHKNVPYGFMVERGTSRAAATPFLRPAFDAKQAAALQRAEAVFADYLRESMA